MIVEEFSLRPGAPAINNGHRNPDFPNKTTISVPVCTPSFLGVLYRYQDVVELICIK